MSGPNPPGPESEELEPGVEPSHSGGEFDGRDSDLGAGAGEPDAEGQTGQTDLFFLLMKALLSAEEQVGHLACADENA